MPSPSYLQKSQDPSIGEVRKPHDSFLKIVMHAKEEKKAEYQRHELGISWQGI